MIFKKVSALLAALLIASGCLASCGNSDEIETQPGETNAETEQSSTDGAFDYKTADLSQYITLCDYKGMDLVKSVVPVTEAEVDAKIESIREEYSHYEYIYEGVVGEGDTVLCDYVGYKDGVAFEGGANNGAEVTAKPDSGYIEGFAESFVGQEPGKEFSFNVTFPKAYMNEELAGQEVTFVCTITCIYGEEMIIPEINDAFAQENFGCATVEELRALQRSELEAKNDYIAVTEMNNTIFQYMLDNSTVIKYPEGEVDKLYEKYSSTYKTYAGYYGMEYEAFLEYYMGTTDEELKESMRGYVLEDLVMYSLIDELDAELTDEEYAENLVNLARMYDLEAEEFEANYGEDAIRVTLLWSDVMKTIASYGTVTEVIAEPVPETEAAE